MREVRKDVLLHVLDCRLIGGVTEGVAHLDQGDLGLGPLVELEPVQGLVAQLAVGAARRVGVT